MATKDTMPLLFLYLYGSDQQRNQGIKFARSLKSEDLYTRDQYWLLLYQLFLDDKISNPYGKKSAFEILKERNISFVDSETSPE